MDFINKQIVVFCGGFSSEREVSLASGKAIYEVLKNDNLNVILYEVTEDINSLWEFLNINKNNIIVFNALHGTFGEDGGLQTILDILKIPYTHSGRSTCAIAINKSITKKIAKSLNIKVANEQIVNTQNLVKECKISFPLVVKPVNEGSSVGVFLVNNQEELKIAEEKCKNLYSKVMLEEYIKGREYTVGVIDGKALAVTEILTNNHKFYDYDSKYKKGGSSHVVPANITKEQESIMFKAAEDLYGVLNCNGVARIDFRGEDNNIYMLEVNTHPGFTATSLLPEQAIYKNISFLEVCKKLISMAKYGDN